MFSIVDDWPALVDAIFLQPAVVFRLPPFLVRAQPLVLLVFLMVRLVSRRHVVRHTTGRHVVLVVRDNVIRLTVGLHVIRRTVTRLRLDRFCDLGDVVLVMGRLVQRLLVDLQSNHGNSFTLLQLSSIIRGLIYSKLKYWFLKERNCGFIQNTVMGS